MSTPTRKLKNSGGTLSGQIDFTGTTHAGIKLNSLTTAQRDALTPANGMLIYNSTTGTVQRYESGAWFSIPAGSISLYAENTSNPTAPTAAGQNSFAIGVGADADGESTLAVGYNANASGHRSGALGSSVNATAAFSYAIGFSTLADQTGQISLCSGYGANGLLSTISTKAFALQPLATKTSDGTTTELLQTISDINTYVGRAAVPDDSTMFFNIRLVARRTDADGESDAWEIKGIIYRDSGAASTTLGPIQFNQIGSSDWGVNVSADTTNGSLSVSVAGESGKTIAWVAVVEMTLSME